MGCSRQEHWSGLPFPPPGDLPDPGIKPSFPVSPALAGRFFTTAPPGKPMIYERFGKIKDFSLSLSDREKGCNDYWPKEDQTVRFTQGSWTEQNGVELSSFLFLSVSVGVGETGDGQDTPCQERPLACWSHWSRQQKKKNSECSQRQTPAHVPLVLTYLWVLAQH